MTFDGSRVTPLVDMEEYAGQLDAALNLVGQDIDPEKNKGDFIFIANW